MTAERTTRVAERIRAELMDLILKGTVPDEGVQVTVWPASGTRGWLHACPSANPD